MKKPSKKKRYTAETEACIRTWARRMVEIEFGTHYSRYVAQMGNLTADIKDHALTQNIDYMTLYTSVWEQAKSQLHPDIYGE